MGASTAARVTRGGPPHGQGKPGGFPPLTRGGPAPFGRYVLLDLLAVGGMADVYVATADGVQGLPPLLAVKRLLPTVTATPDFVAMFSDEARVMQRLVHPGLLRVYEYGQFAGAHFIAMELVRGLDLRAMLDEMNRVGRRMSPTMVAWFCMQLCRALAQAHAQTDERGRPLGLIHRDISPNNLMMRWDGTVKLIDFGIAKHASRSIKTSARVIKGTIAYMSPEQACGERLDQRSDIFSLGACMFEMLTGLRLFWDENRLELLKRVRKARVSSPTDLCPDIPPELSRIVLGCLRKEPRRRPRSAAALGRALEGFLDAQGVSIRSELAGAWMRAVFADAQREETQWLKGLTGRWSGAARPARRPTALAPSEEATEVDATTRDWRPPGQHSPAWA